MAEVVGKSPASVLDRKSAVQTKRILVVEDEKLIALSLESILRSQGYEVMGIFTSGEEALEFLKDNRPDLVLLDIKIAGKMDGVDTAAHISGLYKVPFIFLSAFTDRETLERAKYTQPYGYLIKPFDAKNLNTAIEIALYRDSIERKLRVNEATQAALIHSLPDIILKVTYEGIIEDIHVPAEMEGFVRSESMIGKDLIHILGDVRGMEAETATTGKELLKQVGATGHGITFNYPIHLDSVTYHFEARIVPLDDTHALALVRNITEKKRAEAAVLEAIVKTQDDERTRFAQDLHDSLGQILTAVKFNLDSINPEGGLTENKIRNLGNARNMLSRAIDEARKISHGLMPEVLNTFGLEAALEELCGVYFQDEGIRITFTHSGKPGNIGQNAQVGLYRIAQELLTNIIRHSQATEVNVQLVKHKRKLVLMVEDNGKGITREEARSGIGLRNIRARAGLLGGELIIDSFPGKGTTVMVEIPQP